MSSENMINLTLPVDAAYVSTARLTASSIANRMGFDIDEIEDIKAAVSEAGTYIVKNYLTSRENSLDVKFNMRDRCLEINLNVRNPERLSLNNDDMSLVMIKALMTEFDMKYSDNDFLSIKMVKEKEPPRF